MAGARKLKVTGLDVEDGFVILPTKPSARIGYSFIQFPERSVVDSNDYLLVFLSGLDNPRWVWQKALTSLVSLAGVGRSSLPAMLFYDRFGVGTSDTEPSDMGKQQEEYHNAFDAVEDLHNLTKHIVTTKFEGSRRVRLIFSAHSFGVGIARLYCARFPDTVSAILIMDSLISSTPAENFIPNPDDPDEWSRRGHWHPAFLDSTVITKDQCREAIRKTKASPISGYAMATRERMRWTDMPMLLPSNSQPKLKGVRITTIAYDPEIFIANAVKQFSMPESVIRYGFHPITWAYKDGLPHLQGEGVGRGPIVAKGAGHMIHVDAPDTVAKELLQLVQAVIEDEGKSSRL